MNYSEWPIHSLTVARLRLDEHNPRLPWELQGEGQRQIRYHLIQNDIAAEIAESIADDGFFVHELPIAIQSGDKFIVVEGNRRVAALQVLLNPARGPKNYRNKFLRLGKKIDNLQSLEKIKILIAPDRESAERIIFAKHAKGYTREWKPIMKARFFLKEYLDGLTFEDIADRHAVSITEVEKCARLLKLYEFASSLEYDDNIKRKINNEYEFPLTTLARVFENDPFLTAFRLETDGETLTYKGSDERFAAVVRTIAVDLVTEGDEHITSRVLNNASGRNSYFERVKKNCAIAWDESGKGSVAPKAPNPTPKKDAKGGSEPKKERTREKQSLVPEQFEFQDDASKLASLIQEGKIILPKRVPLASGLLLRSILEHATYRIFWTSGKQDSMLDESKLGGRHGLTSLLKKLHSSKEIVPDQQLRKAIGQFVNSDGYCSLERLNSVTHNEYVNITSEELKSYWALIGKLVQLSMQSVLPTDKPAS